MENDFAPDSSPPSTPDAARRLLEDLDADRTSLADRLEAPGWLYPVLALVAAGYVATPAIPDGTRPTVVGLLLATGIVLVLAYPRLSGVRVARTGARGGALIAALVIATLALLSISFGLVSLTGPWWALAPAAACFGLVLVLGRRFDRLYRQHLRRVR